MKMILKVLALPVLFVVTIACILGNLITNISSYVIALLLLIIAGCSIYCIIKALWTSLTILAGMALAAILIIFLLVWAVVKLETLGNNLVMASTFGLPLGNGAIRGPLKKLIEDYNLPPVVFHSFRHSSVTYNLKLNGGDIKAVQGDSGHAQVNMVTDVYSHILDDDRRKNAELFEEAFYEKKNLDPQMHVQQENNNATVADEVNPELLAKVLANPEMRALLNSLAKTMK